MNKGWIIIFNFICGCHFVDQQTIKFKSDRVETLAKDVQIPKAIFDRLETDVRKETPSLQPVYVFAPMTVALYAKFESVLGGAARKIDYPNGGGTLDLRDYVKEPGTFYLSFPAEQFTKLPALAQLYFVSEAPQKNIDGEKFGLGCGKMVELTGKFESFKKIDFLALNSTDQRYVYVASGLFVFVFRDKNQVHVSQIRVTDSRFGDLLCPAAIAGGSS